MHALMAAVLLGMAGLDARDGDAQTQPPDGKLGEIEEAVGAGVGNAIVGADPLREAALAKEPLEGGDGGVLAGRLQGLAKKQKARRMIGDGEGIAISAVAKLELAFEIGAPEVVRSFA